MNTKPLYVIFVFSRFISSKTKNSWKKTPPIIGTTTFYVQATDPISAGVSGMVSDNQYVFVWELNNGFCGLFSMHTIVVDISIAPLDIAFDGNNIVSCNQDTVILAASNSSVGTRVWKTNSLQSLLYQHKITGL